MIATRVEGVDAWPVAAIRRRYVDTIYGQMHLAECGTGEPVVFLHQSPRSWTEYAGVLPLAGATTRAIALDSPGFGASAPAGVPLTIGSLADGVQATLDALELDRYTLVGHHTGAVVALELAARDGAGPAPRIGALVLSAMPLVTPERRAMVRTRPPIDHVDLTRDGSHLTTLWQRRRAFYEAGEEELLSRFVVDALRAYEDAEQGHVAVNEYEMPERLALVRARTLLVCGSRDSYSMPDQAPIGQALGCQVQVIEGAGVSMPETHPAAFCDAVTSFVAKR